MKRSGIVDLPLHYGRAPYWLFSRMVELSREIVTVIINEYGKKEFLARISDPFWFQSLGCVLGFDWHSSGVTTVVTGALKEAMDPREHGIAVCGGKGRTSRNTPSEIASFGEFLGLSTKTIEDLIYVSKTTAKVDNVAIQSGHPLYHHVIFISEDNDWAVTQQGMNLSDRTARRYHWFSEGCEDLVVEPHSAIVGDSMRDRVLDMTSRRSEGCRETVLELANEDPRKTSKLLKMIRPKYQSSLVRWVKGNNRREEVLDYLKLPSRVNWVALKETYEMQIGSFEELIRIKGIGQATIRGLAILSELIFGDKPSWRDPIKYSFAFGGKDGVPFPVEKEAMDESISFLRETIKKMEIGDRDRLKMLRRLHSLVLRSRCR